MIYIAGDDSTCVATNPAGSWAIRSVVCVLGALGLALGTADVGREGSRIEGSFGVIADIRSPVSGQSNKQSIGKETTCTWSPAGMNQSICIDPRLGLHCLQTQLQSSPINAD